MSEETERYYIEVFPGRVLVRDSRKTDQAVVYIARGLDRLSLAADRCAELNQADRSGLSEPAAFLATLPAYAKRQRAEVLLAELDRVQASLEREAEANAADQSRVKVLRASLLATQSAETASLVPVSTPEPIEALSVAQEARTYLECNENGYALYKPGPY